MKTISTIPAYSRDYKSKAALLKDWEEGKDFEGVGVNSIGYFSSRDLDSLRKAGFTSLQFRYNKYTRTFILNLGELL